MAIILLFVLIEALCLVDIANVDIWPHTQWLRQTVATLASGRPVPPDNDGPWDFRVFWSVGHFASEHDLGKVYSLPALENFEIKNRTYAPTSAWMYPPPAIAVTYLTRLGSYGANFIFWTIFFNAMAALILAGARVPWPVIAATLLSPPALWSDALGQFGLIASALFVASLMISSRRPVRAGLYAGLLTMKPQIGMLLSVVFLAQRNMRAIVTAVLVSLLLVGLSLLAFGGEVWRAYLTEGLASAHAILVSTHDNPGMSSGVSVFWFARKLGLGMPVSDGIQLLTAFVAVIWCWRAWRDPFARPLPRVALTTCLAILVAPYGYVYGLSAYAAGVGLLVWDRGHLRPYDVLLWVFPLLGFNLSVLYHFLFVPPVILMAALYAHQQMRWDAGDRRVERPFAVECT